MKTPESEPQIFAQRYDKEANPWNEIWPAISTLEDECFPGKGIGEEYLKEVFEDSDSIVVILKEGREIVGFTCAIPDEDVEGAIYIDSTEILPGRQGEGHVAKLMNILEEEARLRGYTFITRHAEVLNGYADKIVKNYGDRIVEAREHKSAYSIGGLQRYFKIAL